MMLIQILSSTLTSDVSGKLLFLAQQVGMFAFHPLRTRGRRFFIEKRARRCCKPRSFLA
jgi:hypothetical protein